MDKKVIIPGQLMDLNVFINKQRTNKYAGANAKKQETAKVAAIFVEQRDNILPLSLPIQLDYTWYMSNRRKDKDNIAFSQKFVQDAMIEANIIENDGWSEIEGFSHRFRIDKDNPRIEIKIKEVSRCDITIA